MEENDEIAAWVAARKLKVVRARSLVMTVMMDAVVPHGGAVTLGSLISIGALVGLSEQAIRSAVNRLTSEQWLERAVHGRKSIFRISDAGLLRSRMPKSRIYSRQSGEWTGQWQIIIAKNWQVGNETTVQKARDLQWAGFGRVSQNVFICPERSGSIQRQIGSAVLTEGMVSIIGRPDADVTTSVADLIEHCWDMTIVQTRYQQFMERYSQLGALLRKSPAMRFNKAFALRTMLIHDFRRIRIIDPQLPPQLLPYGWIGDQAWLLARELYQWLLKGSEQYITEFVDGPAETMPPADPALYSRFDGLSPA